MKAQSEQGHLVNLYFSWLEDPQTHGKEMAETIDKIIYSILQKYSTDPIYRRIEDREDLLQDLRLLCIKKLHNIKDPTNKRIFNFLKISIKLALLDKTRRVGKFLDREAKEQEVLGEKVKDPMSFTFCFGDDTLDKVATLLAYGETKQNICTQLGISRSKLNQQIDKLKVIYHEKK
jgi:hypothetical protein